MLVVHKYLFKLCSYINKNDISEVSFAAFVRLEV